MLASFTIDSSVFISAINSEDQFHDDSKKFFAWLEKNRDKTSVYLPIIVVFEVANILKRRGLAKEAERFIKYSGQDFLVNPLDEEFLKTWFDENKNLDIKTNDSIVIMTAYFSNSALITTDAKIIRQGRKIVPVFSPYQILGKLADRKKF